MDLIFYLASRPFYIVESLSSDNKVEELSWSSRAKQSLTFPKEHVKMFEVIDMLFVFQMPIT